MLGDEKDDSCGDADDDNHGEKEVGREGRGEWKRKRTERKKEKTITLITTIQYTQCIELILCVRHYDLWFSWIVEFNPDKSPEEGTVISQCYRWGIHVLS